MKPFLKEKGIKDTPESRGKEYKVNTLLHI